MTFKERVLEVVSGIPKGETRTYSQVANLAGSPKAHRAVASIMKSNYRPEVPCHRVIRSDGSIGGYNRGGEEKKRQLLEEEGAISLVRTTG